MVLDISVSTHTIHSSTLYNNQVTMLCHGERPTDKYPHLTISQFIQK